MIFKSVSCPFCFGGYPEGVPYRCPMCGRPFDYTGTWLCKQEWMNPSLPGIWRLVSMFGLTGDLPVVSLGEGNTPLVWDEVRGRKVAFKSEFQNPTGSFKDRGSATLVSALAACGVREAVEDSSGNAGASFAAYAARAGIQARVYVPEMTSGPKRRQIEAYKADVVQVAGPRSAATEAAQAAVMAGVVYASHAYLPFNLPGYATLALELYEQLGREPGAVIVPAGQGGLLLGLLYGFQAMLAAKMIERMPQMIGVQAKACAPLWARAEGMGEIAGEEVTVAEGVRVQSPARAEGVVLMMRTRGGRFVAVEEGAILVGFDELARRGFYVEPTSALVWPALEATLDTLADPVVAVLTGSGLKIARGQ